MKPLIFENVHLIDPANGLNQKGRLLVEHGLITDIDTTNSLSSPENAQIMNGEGAILCPGLVDMRVSIGEPGYEYRETVSTAAQAAVAGGVTAIAVLPNSNPPIDNPALVQHLRNRGEETGLITLHPFGAATQHCEGKELAEMGLLHQAGAVGFTDGEKAIANSRTMKLVLSYARTFNAVIIQHPEDPSLAGNGAATEGELATRMGLPAIPAAAESIMVARDIRLAELTGGRLHFGHISTAESVLLIRQAKEKGLNITCDTAPPYFDLNEFSIGDFRTYAKLSPPLRAEADRIAIREGLAQGVIDAIASDHCPRDADDKRLPFAQAAAGGTGLATLLAVSLGQVHSGYISMIDMLYKLTVGPARILGIEAGTLRPGQNADLCLFHPNRIWQVTAGILPGKAQNTPFDGRGMEGRVLGTWKKGQRVYDLASHSTTKPVPA
ncbi:dihydroorotase [Entomobacter blattae]|uniref:Dihydroorotase n=1 Tax=Entomobacter blattae TaxID=2762277 RepID=A0A7H1NUN9_9PROT|nr:dihydroorotase [Entomobacter blattae]QNT79499.1 Dihydroorotase [Entomobacter blattae]